VDQFKKILGKYKVDLIVVCADNLEARKLKKNLSEFAKYQINPDNLDDDMNQKD
jgi:sulfur relay (sulfurtransferase) DsrF/TusC family protein